MKTKPKKATTTRRQAPTLRFTPPAWAKLLHLRDAGDTEIGGFGVAAADDLLLIEDVVLVDQTCSWAHVDFDDESVADYFDAQVDRGRRPEEFARVWIHTHPGSSAEPSGTDELTFARVFGGAQWAVMFILARGGQTYARLRFNVGPGGDLLIPVEVDYRRPFPASDEAVWQAEYAANVHEPPPVKQLGGVTSKSSEDDWAFDGRWLDAWDDYVDFDHSPEESDYGYIRDF